MSTAETDEKPLSSALPEPPLLAAGALGGPLVIASLTPLRNAMSNAAQDQSSSLGRLFLNAIGGTGGGVTLAHRLRVGFTGAMVSAPPACPQWSVIGPFFHALHAVVPTPVALLGIDVPRCEASARYFLKLARASSDAELGALCSQVLAGLAKGAANKRARF